MNIQFTYFTTYILMTVTFLNSFGANNTNIFTQLRHERQILLEKEDEKEINFKKNTSTRSSQLITENTINVSCR